MTYSLLEGLRVIESSAFIAAPLAGLTLAQFGAEVIRVDMIGGGLDYARMPRMPRTDGQDGNGRSLYWTALNKAKKSVMVDMRRPEGRELVRALVTAPGEGGGVLLTNIRTPWLEHLELCAARPDLISCTIDGSSDGRSAVDYTVNCAAGYPAITGHGSMTSPVNHVLPAWDAICAHQAAFAIVAAVDRRRRTGQGAELAMALSDVAFTTLSHLGMLAEAELLSEERTAIGNDIYGAFGRDFATRDNRRVMVAAISLGQWQALVKACDMQQAIANLESQMRLDFRDEAQRFKGRTAIGALLSPWFESRTHEQVAALLTSHKVCWGSYGTVRQLLDQDRRVSLGNPVFEKIHTPGVGTHLSAGSAVRIEGLQRMRTQPAQHLGSHTDELLSELLGFTSAEIGRLHDAGIVAGPHADPTA